MWAVFWCGGVSFEGLAVYSEWRQVCALRVDGSLELNGVKAAQNSAVKKWYYGDVVGCCNVRW